MELSSADKERIQHQYDALAKKTVVGEAKSHRRTLAKRAAREVTFSDLSESELVDFNAGVIVENEPMKKTCERFIEYIIKVASGEFVNNEKKGYKEIVYPLAVDAVAP